MSKDTNIQVETGAVIFMKNTPDADKYSVESIEREEHRVKTLDWISNLNENYAKSLNVKPAGYSKTDDLDELLELGIIPDVQTHHRLYGKYQRRDLLEKLSKTNIEKVIFIAPSYEKRCGIGEYGRYLESSFRKIGLTAKSYRTSKEVLKLGSRKLKNALVLVNHGPGLFDGFNPRLGQGESITALLHNLREIEKSGAFPLLMFHSLIDSDNELLFSRQQMILNSEVPTLTFIKSAGKHFYIPHVEMGVPPIERPRKKNKLARMFSGDKSVNGKKAEDRNTRDEIIGFFGFFQYGGKDFDSLFHLVQSLRAKLVGSVATNTKEERDKLDELLDEAGISYDLGSGWVTDEELAVRLQDADYFYLPQNDYDHWNNSATARFVMKLGKPVFLPPHQCYIDVEQGAIFANKEDLPRIVGHVREESKYVEAVKRASEFSYQADMRVSAKNILDGAFNQFLKTSGELLKNTADRSMQRFMLLEEEKQHRYLRYITNANVESELCCATLWNSGVFDSLYRCVEPKNYWKKHYSVDDFVHFSLLESVSSVYLSLRKREISLDELLKICSLLTTNNRRSPGAILSHSISDALTSSGSDISEQSIDVELFAGSKPVVQEDLSEVNLNDRIFANLKCVQIIKAEKLADYKKAPAIDNAFELIYLGKEAVLSRGSTFAVEALDWDAIYSCQSVYKRYNKLVSECAVHGIDLNQVCILDKPVVSTVQPARTCYEIGELTIYQQDDFILNAVRSLFKRNPFVIELIVFREMYRNFGKSGLLDYLVAQPTRRASIAPAKQLETKGMDAEFSHFCEVMRDPTAGGYNERNRYALDARNNERWHFNVNVTVEEYMQLVDRNRKVINSVYYHLVSKENDYAWFDGDSSEYESIENWIKPSGSFKLNAAQIDSLLSLRTGDAKSIATISSYEKTSFDDFHPVEEGGAWSSCLKAEINCLLIGRNKVDHETVLNIRFSTKGGEIDNPKTVTVRLVEDESGSCIDERTLTVTGDKTQSVNLNISDLSGQELVTIELEIDRMYNPHEEVGSTDTRDLGVMVHSMSLLEVDSREDTLEKQSSVSIDNAA